MEKRKILFVSQEISPFLSKSEIATTGRRLPQGIQEAGKEIRVFTPKFGTINERRHQLHEVIRLSGMNLVIDDNDHPLIIKVASIAPARMQVYFIDNEEYFKRKNNVTEEDGAYYQDNDERSMFFCRGVLETVKKLGWQPDVIHCHGWMTAIMALYIKKIFSSDPHFSETKVVYSLYNEGNDDVWSERFVEKLKFDGFESDVLDAITSTNFVEITRAISKFVDGLTIGSENLIPELKAVFDEATCMKLDFVPEENQTKLYSEFFDKVVEAEVLIG